MTRSTAAPKTPLQQLCAELYSACSGDLTRERLTVVNVETNRAFATDGHRLHVVDFGEAASDYLGAALPPGRYDGLGQPVDVASPAPMIDYLLSHAAAPRQELGLPALDLLRGLHDAFTDRRQHVVLDLATGRAVLYRVNTERVAKAVKRGTSAYATGVTSRFSVEVAAQSVPGAPALNLEYLLDAVRFTGSMVVRYTGADALDPVVLRGPLGRIAIVSPCRN